MATQIQTPFQAEVARRRAIMARLDAEKAACTHPADRTIPGAEGILYCLACRTFIR